MDNVGLNIEDLMNVGRLYYEVSEFNRLAGRQDSLTLLQQNVRSLC